MVLFLAAGLAPQTPQAQTPDWDALGAAVIELQAFAPGSETPTQGIGFLVAEVPGIVTSYRLIQGAERVVAQPASGRPIEIRSYIAYAPETDLIVLEGEKRAAGLETSTFWLVTNGQYAFALRPASYEPPMRTMQMFTQFLAAGLGESYAVAPGAPTGAPLADSLGQVIGMIEALDVGESRTSCIVPIEHLDALRGNQQAGGLLSDLAAIPPAAWTQPGTAANKQVRGAIYCRGRRFAEGMPLISEGLAAEPDMVSGQLELGMCYQMQGQHEQAEALYRKAVAAHPEHPLGHLYLGSCLHMQGLYLQAQQTYEQGLALHPQWSRLHVNLGGIYFLQKKRTAAEESFREALRLQPNLGIARYNLGVLCVTQQRLGEAQEQLDFLRAHKSGYAEQLGRFVGGQVGSQGR